MDRVIAAAHPSWLAERRVPEAEELQEYLLATSNWGRWGPADQLGTLNLISDEGRRRAARLVRAGRAISLGRDVPRATAEDEHPAPYFLRKWTNGDGGHVASDFSRIAHHSGTHLDALSHVWDERGIWNGQDPEAILTPEGATSGAIDAWRHGIVTRGVLLDVPAHRGEPYVRVDAPVHAWELDDILRAQGLTLEAGDAAVVYGGLDPYLRAKAGPNSWDSRPGLDTTCVAFLREHDAAVLVWDMGDRRPYGYGLPFAVHYAIPAYGMAFVDGALLEPLAVACREERRYEFLLIVSPLVLPGGTASPVNPIAVL